MSIGKDGQDPLNEFDKQVDNPQYSEKQEGSLPEMSAGLRPCPHCGYCPTCGRPQNVPIYPPVPYYNPWGGPWCGVVNTATHFDTRPPNV
jgi:hypothetical protein